MFDRGAWLLIYGAACGLLGGLGGFHLGRATTNESLSVPENIAPQQSERNPDESLTLERNPAAKLPEISVPQGANIERRTRATVQPDTPKDWPNEGPSCPPVSIDMTLLQIDGGRRVVASSPDGRIVGGIDVPAHGFTVQTQYRWAAGITGDPVDQEVTAVWIDRDFGRVRVGAEFGDDRSELKFGWRFR